MLLMICDKRNNFVISVELILKKSLARTITLAIACYTWTLVNTQTSLNSICYARCELS